jgi:hypothetical protein
MLNLEPVVQRIAESVRPVKERKKTESKQVKPRERQPGQSMQVLILGSVDPSKGKGQAHEEKMYWYDESGDDTASTEQRPENRLIGLLGH